MKYDNESWEPFRDALAALRATKDVPESVRLELAALLNPWRPIETAPRDGRAILLLSAAQTVEFPEETIHIGKWNPEGTSWTDDYGTMSVTGIWESGGGWFQPNEVTRWLPLPAPPSEDVK